MANGFADIFTAWQAQNRLKNNTVVGTQMTNLGVRHGYKDLGIDFIETDVGSVPEARISTLPASPRDFSTSSCAVCKA
jgi:hypothetical protein